MKRIWLSAHCASCIALATLLVGCGTSYPPDRLPPANAAERAAQRAEDVRMSGPGYPDLKGKVFNYAYDGFAGFRVLIDRNRLRFEGVSGEFEGISMLQAPQFTKVAEDVYFMSWQVMGDMGDNVVVNLRDMRVFGHLGAGKDYRKISGEIACFGSPTECDPPSGRLQSPLESVARVMLKRAGNTGGDSPVAPTADHAAAELEDHRLRYTFEDGTAVDLRFSNQQVWVAGPAGEERRGAVFTKPAAELYFISWDGEHGGEHIVLNLRTREVHDQIAAGGARTAMTAKVTYFGPS